MKPTQKTLLSLFIASFCANTSAQENNEVASSDEAVLDTVTVSARGIAEDWLDTPFVVKTIDANAIADAHLTTAEDAFRANPSAAIHNGGNVEYSGLKMRGSGSLSITSLDDSSVDFRVDGVSNGKSGWGRNLIDVERIETAKGPQGTLLGSDAEAGGVSIKTADPADEFDARLSLGMGNKHAKSLEAMLNLPIAENFALRVAGLTAKEDNHAVQQENDKPLNTKTKQGIQAKLGWHDDSYQNEVVLSVYHDKNTNSIPFPQLDFDTYKVPTFGLPHEGENLSKGTNLTVNSDIGFADLTSVTAYHQYDSEVLRPLSTPVQLPLQYQALGISESYYPVLNQVFSVPENNRQYLEHDFKQWSQEFRLASQPDSETKWVAGLYFDNKKRHFHNDSKISLADLAQLDPNTAGYLTSQVSNADIDKDTTSSTQAIFGEITYPATQQLDLIAGARLTHKKQEHQVKWVGNSNNIRAQGGVKTDNKTLSDTALTGRAGLSYAVKPNWRIYALQSRGNKFGGFEDYGTNVPNDKKIGFYESSTINASEIGTKFQSEDGRLNLGVAVFQNTVKDDHVSIKGYIPAYTSEIANVDTRSRGLEVDADWQATEHLKLYGDIALINTKVTHVPASATSITKVGKQMPLVPKVSASIGVQYRDDISLIPQGEWFADVNYHYVGDRYADANNSMKLDAYGLLNAKIGIGNDHHTLSLWGKNLTDERYLYIGIPSNLGNFGTLAPERTFGIDYTYQF